MHNRSMLVNSGCNFNMAGKTEGKSNMDKKSLLLNDDDTLPGEEDIQLPESVKRSLLLESETPSSSTAVLNDPLPPKSVIPEPGFCVKTKTDKGEKVFINICKSIEIPSPKDITDEQLQSILQSNDPTHYRVPLSLGEPHTERDNSKQDCTVYDVIISNEFYDTIQARPVMKDFLLTIALEGLEDKYSLRLCRDCKIMKNRKFMGQIPEQTVRKKPKPFIIEMNENDSSSSTGTESMTRNESEVPTAPEPEYTLIREPDDGEVPEYLVMEIKLPKVTTSKSLVLDVGVDRLLVIARPNLYHLHVDLPFTVEPTETGAQFNKDSRILFITMPVNGIIVENVL